ncbi:ATP-dependent DNA helicase [Thalassotalea ponticola]|uniref:ATP-dependent DNA helicase n=1 Tax=Thalassotalea ponticola TaxID=1523392 RepID=UPI0025B4857B|nr:ATP-dependent DNA helicase [Thalassotalea ponticola]MDN3651298.1 ATP-dependent DNA helicase [Thalassotalea ponticola]
MTKTTTFIESVDQAFAEDGALAKVINGYRPRQAQRDMALKVADVIQSRRHLVVEAGTGTGKTFAYLLPSIISGKKVIVSTGTKNLQEQLFHKDLPLVKQALESGAKIALLKGRANYLCLFRLEENFTSAPTRRQKSAVTLDSQGLADLVKVRQWASQTQRGDIGELVEVSEDSTILPLITSTVDNCLGRNCPDYEKCYLVKARERAANADLVVVNHHLYFADMALKDTGFGELIPKSDVVVFDEAHQIADIASEYFGKSFSTKQILELASDCMQQYRLALTDVQQLLKASEKLARSAGDFRLLFAPDPTRGNWREQIKYQQFSRGFTQLHDDLKFLHEVLTLCVSRTEVIDNCFERCQQLLAKYQVMQDTQALGMSLWFETTRRHVVLHQTPLSVADKFAAHTGDDETAFVFTSATLSVNGDFSHFTQGLGLADAQQLMLQSPFDYQQQSLLLVPRYLPHSNDRNRARALANIAIPLIKASRGNCFLLFTSYRMLNQVAELLTDEVDNTLLVQGQTAKSVLLEQFIDDPHAVLLATASFWEGVDVRGDSLTCVIIDKLPFSSPDEPLLQAKSDDVRRQGGDPFKQIQLPEAVIALKQGVGRLIRDVNDKGVLAICDTRLVNRPYGGVFLSSLPNMQRTRELNKAMKFLQSLHQEKQN